MAKVLWTIDALNDLAGIWMTAGNRAEVNQSIDAIDRELVLHPMGAGESREDGRRVLLHSPLGVAFAPEPDGQTVWVHSVWYYSRRKKS